MNDVEYDFLKKIALSMDINDIIDVLGINEEDLVNAFSEYILEHKFYAFKEFLDGTSYEGDETEEV